MVPPARRVDLRLGAVEIHGAADPASDVEVVGEDGPCRPRSPRERLRVGEGAWALVDELELDVAAVALEQETQTLAIAEDALGTGAKTNLVKEDQREPLAVPTESAAAVLVDAAPQIRRPAVQLVADAVVPAESAHRVAPRQVRALLPVGVVTRRVQTLVLGHVRGHPRAQDTERRLRCPATRLKPH